MRYRFFSLLAAAIVAFGICGCGSGGTSADPLGTDGMMFGHKNDAAGTDWSTAMAVNLRGTVILTAKVKNASGTAVVGREVSFGFVSNTSGATLSSTKASTDSTGEAMTLYTAGMVAGFDVIRASISNGATLDTNITVGAGGTGGITVTVAATPSSLVADAMSVIVADVSNADGTPASGETVTFAFVTNNSGAPALALLNGGVTDANGLAVATYTAGSNSSGLSIQDTVSASVPGSAGEVIITRLPATGTGNRISLTLTPATTSTVPLSTTTSNCIVTATVVRDDGTTPVAGETVTFSIVTGGGAIAPLTVTTNNSGIANAIFTAPGGPTGLEGGEEDRDHHHP